MKVNNADLTKLVDNCFDRSMDGRVKQSDQKDFLAMGKRLRGSLLNLLTAEFEEGTPDVVKANSMIQTLNEDTRSAQQVLNETSQVIAQLGKLVAILDDLLKMATAFH